MPKSSSFTWPLGVTITLDGLRSRCTTRLTALARENDALRARLARLEALLDKK